MNKGEGGAEVTGEIKERRKRYVCVSKGENLKQTKR